MKYAPKTHKGARGQGPEAKHDRPVSLHRPPSPVSSAMRYFFWVGSLIVLFSLAAPASGPEIVVELDISHAGPRRVEPQTEGRILADYRLAWADIAQTLNSNDSVPLQGVFIGAAKDWLNQTLTSQRQSGITTRYFSQTHRLQAVFYAPEGDLIALHDTAEYNRQVVADGKVILEDRGVHRYVVIMTPGADRWVVRELIEVQNF
jgi:hypothetical protein